MNFLKDVTAAMDMTDTPMFCKNIEGMILYANPSFAQIAGIQPGGETYVSTDSLFDASYQKIEKETDERLIATKQKIEFSIKLTIGSIQKSYRCQKALFSLEENEPFIVVSMKEIHAMDVFSGFIDQFFLVVEYSPVSIIVTDPEGTIQYVNKTFTQVTGYTKEEAIGQNPRILKSGVLPKDFYEELWKTISSGKPWRGEFHNITKTGEPFWEIASISPIFDRLGNITNYVAIKENITYLKNKQEELRKLEERNREILEAIPDIMVRLNGKGEILDNNLREKIDEVLPENERENARMYIEHTLQTGVMQVYEYPVERDNETHYYEARFIVSGEDEVLSIIRNITERIKVEQQIKSAREIAENANRSKSAFLATMSHEIRTPLHSISGFIELMKKTPLNETQKEYLHIIAQSAENLLGIINDVLDFSKIESGKMEIEHVAFDPFSEFETIFELFAKRAGEKNISFYPYIEPNLPRSIASDPLRIRQVLFNLLSNAIKFTPEGGKIFVDIKPIQETANTIDIHFAVKDTGIGIPPHKREIIFESFTQADSSVTRKYGGTGLGLAISKNLVSLLGGSISLESTPGKGSTFSFIIPVKKVKLERENNLPMHAAAYIYAPGESDSDLTQLLLRYFSSLRIDAKIIFRLSEISAQNGILFLVEPSAVQFDYSEIAPSLTALPIPAVLVKSRHTQDAANELLHVSKILYLPISYSKLFNCVIEILGHDHFIKKDAGTSEKKLPDSFTGNVLVAEDNQVNQKLITLMLKEYGLSVDLVNNGLDAYYQYLRKPYDLILMDVNMPVTGGIEATRMIRMHEKEHALPQIPIIALTAQAMKGDREHFLESGMTGYLSKPIEINKLEETLASIFAHTQIATHTFSHTTPSADSSKKIDYDLEKTAASLGISAGAFRDIILEFLAGANNVIEELQIALKSGNAPAIQHASHRLKGAAANLRFDSIAETAGKMENDAKSENLDDAASDIEKIKKLFEAYKYILDVNTR